MMKLVFSGGLQALNAGINELAPQLGIELAEGGYVFELRSRFIELRKIHMKNWFKIYKAFGWDIMDMRYGSLLARIDSAIVEIEAYLAGEMDRIEELEEERRYYGGQPGSIRYLNFFGDIVSPSRIAPKA